MDSKYFRAAELVSLYIRKEISDQELQELEQLTIDFPQLNSWIEDQGLDMEEINKRHLYHQSINKQEIWRTIIGRSQQNNKIKISWRQIAAMAAALILTLSVAFYFYQQRILKTDQQNAQVNTMITPGSKKATLTLSDGSKVELGTNLSDRISDGSTSLEIHQNGLDYSNNKAQKPTIHKLTIPTGATYNIELADGTKVWLNAQSELEFPSVFSGEDRIVKVTGEAYFEVAKDAKHPFKVNVNGTEVQALGTAFNINTHLGSNKIKTILTEGRIKVTDGGQNRIITAGHETISGQGEIEVNKADIEEALSWKEGYFYFNSKDLKEILGEISRWYAIDIDIQRKLTNEHYNGGIKRSASIETVCKTLNDLTGFQFTVSQRKLIIK